MPEKHHEFAAEFLSPEHLADLIAAHLPADDRGVVELFGQWALADGRAWDVDVTFHGLHAEAPRWQDFQKVGVKSVRREWGDVRFDMVDRILGWPARTLSPDFKMFVRQLIHVAHPFHLVLTEGGLGRYGSAASFLVGHREPKEFIRDIIRQWFLLEDFFRRNKPGQWRGGDSLTYLAPEMDHPEELCQAERMAQLPQFFDERVKAWRSKRASMVRGRLFAPWVFGILPHWEKIVEAVEKVSWEDLLAAADVEGGAYEIVGDVHLVEAMGLSGSTAAFYERLASRFVQVT